MKRTKHLTARSLLVIFVLSIGTFAQTTSKTTRTLPHSQLVDVGGHKLWMESAGTGGPTVVLDYGLGGPTNTWRSIFPRIAAFTRVVRYERAGYGRSEMGPEPRSYRQVATEMRAMLKNAAVPGPYVLVGHSLGNAHIRAFADMYPDDVAGMVFIDPLNFTIFERLDARQSADDDELVRKALAGPPSGRRSEVEFMAVIDKDFAQLKAIKMPPDVPMILLIAGKHEAGQVWVRSVFEEYSPIIFSSSEGGMTVAATASHYIHRDDPELVIESIRRVAFPSVKRVLEKVLKSADAAAVERKYREMRRYYPTVYFLESDLNSLGYARVRAKDIDGAIRLFKLNVETYPRSANPYDSLGETYALRGDRDLAIRNYKMALKLDPERTSTRTALEKLGAAKK